jgi:hypothetical protein
MAKGSNKSEAKTSIKNWRRTVTQLQPHQGGSIFQIRAIESPGKGRRKVAVISTGHSDFFDPISALRLHLAEEADPTKQPGPCVQLDPATVTITATNKNPNHGRFHFKSFAKRMRNASGPFLRMWQAPRQIFGPAYFFLFPNRVILETWERNRGWKFIRVPEEGLAALPSVAPTPAYSTP